MSVNTSTTFLSYVHANHCAKDGGLPLDRAACLPSTARDMAALPGRSALAFGCARRLDPAIDVADAADADADTDADAPDDGRDREDGRDLAVGSESVC
eukprot:m.241278 g.241278  ORF g.241278 m.241278 type:complete len:98 (+) comp18997_c0_seq4:38-331(+)